MYKRGLNDWLEIFSFRQMAKRKLFILGGKDLGLFLINYWRNIFKPIVIIEPSLQQCNILASKLERPLILHGEGTELQLIKQEGLNKSSIFLAASSDDLQNLVSGFGAQKLGCRTVVSLINESIHKEIANLLNLNNIIFIPELVSDYVLNFLQTEQKLNKYILGNQIYTSKIILNDNFLAVNKKIKELKLPAGIIIGIIIRDGNTIIPDGDNKLISGYKLIIFFEKRLESKIKHIF
jgi:trk system potassium uptake protein TrkA